MHTSAYVDQNDLHQAELTVRETLDFAARCQGIGHKGGQPLLQCRIHLLLHQVCPIEEEALAIHSWAQLRIFSYKYFTQLSQQLCVTDLSTTTWGCRNPAPKAAEFCVQQQHSGLTNSSIPGRLPSIFLHMLRLLHLTRLLLYWDTIKTKSQPCNPAYVWHV